MSIGFYEENAEDFFARTAGLDPPDALARFAGMLPAGGRVLDAGCGSGRDAKVLAGMGFAVTATEAAPRLAAMARAHAGVEVLVLRFDEMAWGEAFDGVWACASLLHVPRAELAGAVRRLRDALAAGGLLFMSFKYGSGEREAHGRWFTDLDEAAAQALLTETGGLELLSMEVTGDVRPDKALERWLGVFCRRKP